MRHVCFAVLFLCCGTSAIFAQTVPSENLPLPKSHVWESKAKQVCKSVGSVEIRQAKDTPEPSDNFLVAAGRGMSRLEITLNEKEVLVSVDGAEPEKYKIVANTVGVTTAVLVGEIEPTISSVVVDKITSYVIWSTTKPRDFTRDVPRHTAELLTCSSLQP